MMKISNDTENLLSMIRVREDQLVQEEQQAANNSRTIILNARNEAAAIIAAAKNNASSIEAELTMKKKQMDQELIHWKEEQELIAATVTFDSVIHLNVGGHKFDTTVATMTRFPESMLGAMFSGRHQLPKDKDGYYFIDQDGTHFRHIINFLRNPEGFVITLKGEELAELKNQAAYYLLEEKMFPYVFEKLPPQTLSVWSFGRVRYPTVTLVQNEKGIWKFDIASHDTVEDHLSEGHKGPWDVLICTSCCRGYAAVNGEPCSKYDYIFMSLHLPLVKDQLIRSTCSNCKY
jgi:vacuolar-type H+-ATPase subunit H